MLQRWGIFDQLSELTEQTNINWLSSLQFNLQPVFQYYCIIIHVINKLSWLHLILITNSYIIAHFFLSSNA